MCKKVGQFLVMAQDLLRIRQFSRTRMYDTLL